MHRQEALPQRCWALKLPSVGPTAISHVLLPLPPGEHAVHRLAWRTSVSRSAPASLLGSNTPQCAFGLRKAPVQNHGPHPLAAVPRQRQQHQPRSATQGPETSPEVQELLKRLVRTNSPAIVVKELRAWRETAPGVQQRRSAAVVGSAALQILTRVLHPGAKLHPQQEEELEVRAWVWMGRRGVWEARVSPHACSIIEAYKGARSEPIYVARQYKANPPQRCALRIKYIVLASL